jgi:small-conductance mechanosensitive channel
MRILDRDDGPCAATISARHLQGLHLRHAASLIACLVLLCAASSLTVAAEQTPQATAAEDARAREALAGAPAGAPVVVWNRTLAVLRAPYGGTSAADRAAAASDRIEAILDELDPNAVTASPATIGSDSGVIVQAGEHALFGLLPGDLPQGSATTLESAGQYVAGEVKRMLEERIEQRRTPQLILNTAYALLGISIYFALIIIVLRVRRRALSRTALLAQQWPARLALAGFDPRPVAVILLRWTVRLTAFAIILTASYVTLTFVLSRFPYTRPWGTTLGALIVSTVSQLAAAAVHALPDLLTIAIIVLATRALVRLVKTWFGALERGDFSVTWLEPEAARATSRLLVIGIWLFAITVAYPYVPGSDSLAFKGASVFLGLMISLGSAGLLNQLLGGIAAVYSRGLRPGDFVCVGEIEGRVLELRTLATRIVTRTGEVVTIPNAVLMSGVIRNFSRSQSSTLLLTTAVSIGYDTPWRQVEVLLLTAAARTQEVLASPAPHVLKTALSDFYIEYELAAHAAPAVDRDAVMSVLHANILDAFNEHHVQIMSPHFEGQPDRAMVVPPEKWRAAPAQGR